MNGLYTGFQNSSADLVERSPRRAGRSTLGEGQPDAQSVATVDPEGAFSPGAHQPRSLTLAGQQADPQMQGPLSALTLVSRFDPACAGNDPENDPEAAVRIVEVTTPEDRAIGARVTNSAQWHGASIVEACSKPLVDATGDQYTPALDELACDLKLRFAKVAQGDLSDPEAMLLAQAHALQAIFSTLALKSLALNSLPSMHLCLSVALKAQAQSRASLTALAEMKHPRQPNFIGQQNVAMHQQVNNQAAGGSSANVQGENQPIKLLEIRDGERLDGRTADAASSRNQAVETVGEVDRTEDGGR